MVLLASGRTYFGYHPEWTHVGVVSICLIVFPLITSKYYNVILVQGINVDNGLALF